VASMFKRRFPWYLAMSVVYVVLVASTRDPAPMVVVIGLTFVIFSSLDAARLKVEQYVDPRGSAAGQAAR